MSPNQNSPDQTVDALGQTCPAPLLSATRTIRDLDVGAVVDIVSDCEGAGADLQAWANATGNHLLETRFISGRQRAYRIHKGYKADATLDLRGQRCPVPVIEAARAVNQLAVGSILRLICDCPRAPEEVGSWAQATGHDMLSEVSDQNGTQNFYVRKSATRH